jgi:hypothetical protein
MEILGATHSAFLKMNPSAQSVQVFLGVPGTGVRQWSSPLETHWFFKSALALRTLLPAHVAQLSIAAHVRQEFSVTGVQEVPSAAMKFPDVH